MKKILLAILSLCLIAASLFGLFSGVTGLKDVLNIKDYKLEDADNGRAQINDELLPGIQQLRENYDVYMEGVQTLEDGKQQLAAGAAQLAAGEAQLAAGKAELAANTETYNRGKELQGTLNQVNALIGQWNAAKNAVVNGTESLLDANPFDVLHIGSQSVDAFVRFNEGLFLNTARSLLSTDLITNTLGMSIDIPADADTFPNWFQGFVAHANSELARYEDGVRQVAEGEAQLAAGYAEYAAGQQQLADGEKQLAEFEQGQVTLLVGLARLLTQPAYQNNYVGQVYPKISEVPGPLFENLLNNIEESDRGAVADAIYPGFWGSEDSSTWGFPKAEGEGKVVCPSMIDILRGDEYLGPNFDPSTDLFEYENGAVKVRNGYPVANLDAAQKIADAGLEYIDNYQSGAVMKEVIGKLISYALLLVGSLAGILAGLFGIIALFGKGSGPAKGFGCVSLLSALGGLIATLVTGGFRGYAFGVTEGAENAWGHVPTEITGKQQLLALIILAVAALLFFLVASAVRKAVKKAKKAKKSEAYVAAAPVAQPVYAAPVAEPVVAQPVYAAPVVEPVAEPVVVKPVYTEPVVAQPVYATAAAAVSAAEAAAEAAQKAAAEARAAAAIGDVAAAEKAAAAAEKAAKAARKAAKEAD